MDKSSLSLLNENGSFVELLGRAVDSQIDQTVGVSPFVVVPGDNLVEVVVEEDASIGVDGRGMLVRDEVTEDDQIFGVSKDSFEFPLRSFLEGSKDFLTRSSFLCAEGQVDNRDIGSRNLKMTRSKDNVYDELIWHRSEHQPMLPWKKAKELTRMAIPVSFPLRAGRTFPTALAAPVDAGMELFNAQRPARQSLPPLAGPSTTSWLAVEA